MSDAPAAYPLAWPKGRPRTPWKDRIPGGFTAEKKRATIARALDKLEDQCDRFEASYPLVSTDLPVKLNGKLRAGAGEPNDPGAALYFTRFGKPYVLACDTFTTLAQNIAAIANHIDATRRIERYGVASAEEMLQAFSALPPPPPGGSTIIGEVAKHWSEVLGLDRDKATADTVGAVYRTLARDAAGDTSKLLNLNLARDAALRDLGAR